MHSSENVFSFSCAVSRLVALFQLMSSHDDLKSVTLLNQAVGKLPTKSKQAWSTHTVRRNWQRPSLLDFNKYLKDKVEGHEKLHVNGSRPKMEETVKPKTTNVFASIIKCPSDNESKSSYPPCLL